MSMFDLFKDMWNYKLRKVARDKYEWGYISTAFVSDGIKPYETAVRHQDYIRDEDKATHKTITVESYSTIEEAALGHQKWVKIMENPPAQLEDCANGLGGMALAVLGKQLYSRKK